MSIGLTWPIIATTFGSGIDGGRRSEACMGEGGLDFEDLVTALEQPPTCVGTAATNVFVRVTRPRALLDLTLRKSEAMALIGPATDQGWKLVNPVARAAELKE